MYHVQDPDDVLDYEVDWSAFLGDDPIVTSLWYVTPSGAGAMTVASPAGELAGAKARAFVSGGVSDVEYRLTNRVTTAGGRTVRRSHRILCQAQ